MADVVLSRVGWGRQLFRNCTKLKVALGWLFAAACSRSQPPPVQTSPSAAPIALAPTARAEVSIPDECAAAESCFSSGNCVSGKQGCEPRDHRHCLDSVGCQRDGMCRLLRDGSAPRCGSESHDDCARSTLCSEAGRCLLAPSGAGNTTCIAAKLRTAQRLTLSETRHGIQGELRVLVDSRLSTKKLNDGQGYVALEEDLMAASSVRLLNSEGVVQGELTLHPAVDVIRLDFGSGTDTFLVTEHFGCIAGKFCGWRTRFFELKQGKLEPVRALDAVGTSRDVETTASFAARWTLRPGTTSGTREILSQEEDPLRSTWIERRFFYQDKSWRVIEREAPTGDAKMAARPGAWQGKLD